jgi:AmmeMemoRadiSam system protein A/AmmeMemoRadiSam system protein B
MRDAAACVLRHRPDALVLVSPHAPRRQRAFGIWGDNPMQGAFDQFNVPDETVSLPLDSQLAQTIADESHRRQLATWTIHRCPLDHGALVPLWFLAEAGWAGPAVVLSLNDPEANGLVALGEAIAAAAAKLSRRVAFVASGDMSHRLMPGAPCGFHPQARRFDETFIQLVRTGEYGRIKTIAPKLRECAAEDVVDATLIAAAAVNWQSSGHRVLNYEGPFGVGYGVAILFTEKNGGVDGNPLEGGGDKYAGATLPGVARRSVMKVLLAGTEAALEAAGSYLRTPAGVFVTIRRPDGTLRGCVGTITPATPDIVAETWRNARLAAFHDRRFPPVAQSELGGLRFEVSVLHPPETIRQASDLDPARYGIIVSVDDGRRGLLLPGIQEIKTPEEQLRLAREKGGIGPDEPATVQRFQVDHFAEAI